MPFVAFFGMLQKTDYPKNNRSGGRLLKGNQLAFANYCNFMTRG